MQAILAVLVIAVSLAAAEAGPVRQAAPTAPLAALDGATITLDPGHNGGNGAHPDVISQLVPAGGFRKECDTTGTETADGRITEATFTWQVTQRLKRLLEHQGARVVLTRKNNHGVGPCVNERAKIGNRARSDVALSIHGDGGPREGRGFHVIRPALVRGYTDRIVKPSAALAIELRSALTSAGLSRADYIARNGIDRRGDLGGLNLSKVPKVFVELGNMQNHADAKSMQSRRWRDRVARALRDGLARYLTGRKQ